MSVVQIRPPTRGELRWFGLLLLAVFTMIAGLVHWRLAAPRATCALLGVGAALALLYYSLPPLRRPLYLGWMHLVSPIGWLVSHAMLGLVYFGVISPIGVAMRLFGRDKLERRLVPSAASYWTQRPREIDPSRYFRQS
jgi:hypothetical protein